MFWVAKASEAFYSGPRLNYSAFSAVITDRGSRAQASPKRSEPQPQRAVPATAPKPRTTRFFPASVDLTQQAEEQLKLVEANKKLKEEAMALPRMEEDDEWQSVRNALSFFCFNGEGESGLLPVLCARSC